MDKFYDLLKKCIDEHQSVTIGGVGNSAYAVGDAVDHNFVDGICAKCGEAVIVDVTEPADAIEVPETTAPSIEEEPQNSGSNVVWVVIAAVTAVVLITVFVRKHQKS